MKPTKNLRSTPLGASCLALALLAASVLLAPRSAAGDGAPGDTSSVGTGPSILYSRLDPSERPDPIWVSATELADERGGLSWDMLDAPSAERWKRIEPETDAETKAGGDELALIQRVEETACPFKDVSSWPSPVRPSVDGLQALIEGAEAAFAGTVVERTPGFLIGKIATVLTVEVTETFRAGTTAAALSPVYVAYPQGRFRVAGKVFCGRHQKGPDAPEVGSNVLVLAQSAPIDDRSSLFQISVQEIASQSPENELILPQTLREDERIGTPGSWQEFLDVVRRGFSRQLQERSDSGSSRKEGS